MAQMRPSLSEERLSALSSPAEARFYRACRDHLPDRVHVLHSVAAVRRSPSGAPRDLETDFVILDPSAGVLIVEVKGGGIAFDPAGGCWYSTDGRGTRHEIKDPFRQATGGKYAVLDALRSHPRWPHSGVTRLTIGHAVAFPDVTDATKLVTHQGPAEIVAGRRDLEHLDQWVDAAFGFWAGEGGTTQPLGQSGLQIAEEVFCRPLAVRPSLHVDLQHEESVRIRLTEQQARLLRALGSRPRAAISGGAGTGKTVIAMRRAWELAASGKRTLLVCYTRALADYLKRQPDRPASLQPLSFHQLCDWRVAQARAASGRDLMREAQSAFPGADAFDVHRPYALALSCDVLPGRYDAIVVDEGQDFRSEFWLPLEMLLADELSSTFYVFYDPNQAIYTRAAEFPNLGDPFLLLTNCRNTRWIHDAAYTFFRGEETEPPELEGAPVTVLDAAAPEAQARRIHAAVVRMLSEDGVPPSDVVVLIAGMPKSLYYDLLTARPLPGRARWAIEDHAQGEHGVIVDTVARFKGLEASVVFLWGLDGLDAHRDRETLYVGLSRAKSRLVCVGTSRVCAAILPGAAPAVAAG